MNGRKPERRSENVKKLALWAAKFVVGNLIFMGIVEGCENLAQGKTFFGKPKKEKDQTRIDYQGRVVMGSNDYMVE